MEREDDYSYTPIEQRLANMQTRLDKDYNESQDALFLNNCEGLNGDLSKKVCRLITDCAVPNINVRIEDNPYGSTMPPSHPPEDIPVQLLAELMPCCYEGRTICPEFEITEPREIKSIDSMFMSKEVDIDLGKLKIGIDFDTEQECCDPEKSEYDYIRLEPSMDCEFECTMEPIEFEHAQVFAEISGRVPAGIRVRCIYVYINKKYTLITGDKVTWKYGETVNGYTSVTGKFEVVGGEISANGELHYVDNLHMYKTSARVRKVKQYYIDIGYTRVYYDIKTRGVVDICDRTVDVVVDIPHEEKCIVDEGVYQHETQDTVNIAGGTLTVKLNENKRVDWCEPNIDITNDKLSVTLNPRAPETYRYNTQTSYGSHGCVTNLTLTNDVTVDWTKGRISCNPLLKADHMCGSVQSNKKKVHDSFFLGCGNPNINNLNPNNIAGLNGTLFNLELSSAPELYPSGAINPHLNLKFNVTRSNTLKTVGVVTDVMLVGDVLKVTSETLAFIDGLFCDKINKRTVDIPIGDILMQAVSCEKLKHCHFCECSDSSSSSSCDCATIEAGVLPEGAQVTHVAVEVDGQYTVFDDIISIATGPSRVSPGDTSTFVQFNKCIEGEMKQTGQLYYTVNGTSEFVTGLMFDYCEDIGSDSASISESSSSSSSDISDCYRVTFNLPAGYEFDYLRAGDEIFTELSNMTAGTPVLNLVPYTGYIYNSPSMLPNSGTVGYFRSDSQDEDRDSTTASIVRCGDIQE